MNKHKGYDGSYPRIYAMLKTRGHDAAKAIEILIACKRRDRFALDWVRCLRSLSK